MAIQLPVSANTAMKNALEEIRASILAQRGSLEGLLDEFLAERREEALREFEDCKSDGKIGGAK
jgi:hypothetical protein